MEQKVESALESEGVPILGRDKVVRDAMGAIKGDLDFELTNAIIEVTVSSEGKAGQMAKSLSR